MSAVGPYFLATSLLVIASPGPDAVLTVQLVLRTGRRAPAAVGAAGMVTAACGHATLALTGVSLVIRSNPALWTAMRWVGAAVLVVWGVRALVSAFRPTAATTEAAGGPDGRLSLRRCYGLGLLSTGSNPKVGVFLLAYLPQFAGPHDPQRTVALLAAVYVTLAACWLALLITVTDALRRRASSRERGGGKRQWPRLVESVLGLLFIGFAVRLGLQG